jgi:hypothetical protein
MALEIAADGGADGRKEELVADLREKSESLELVFDGVFELGETQLDFRLMQSFVQFQLLGLLPSHRVTSVDPTRGTGAERSVAGLKVL